MNNDEKKYLVYLCKNGYSFSQIRRLVSCSNATIKRYMKIFTLVKNELEEK